MIAAFTMFGLFIIDEDAVPIQYIDMSDYPVYISPEKGD
tara:strand:+ start:279 stop:395 length:117 start_codon:yes stop_codon:yes gene_type:complete